MRLLLDESASRAGDAEESDDEILVLDKVRCRTFSTRCAPMSTLFEMSVSPSARARKRYAQLRNSEVSSEGWRVGLLTMMGRESLSQGPKSPDS